MIFTLHFLLNEVGDLQEEEVADVKKWNKPPDKAVVCFYSLRLIYIIYVFLHQEKREGCLDKHLVKRQTCSYQGKFGCIYV